MATRDSKTRARRPRAYEGFAWGLRFAVPGLANECLRHRGELRKESFAVSSACVGHAIGVWERLRAPDHGWRA